MTLEELWKVAACGHEAALVELYERCAGMWRAWGYVDPNGQLESSDWEAIAKEEFLKRWRGFRGGRFSTYIYQVIRHRYNNEVRFCYARRRRADVSSITTEQENYLPSIGRVDESQVRLYYNRFVKWLETVESEVVVKVARVGLWLEQKEYESIARLLSISVNTVKEAYRRIRQRCQQFICMVKQYDKIVFGGVA